MSIASGLPTLPPAGRAAHHGVPCAELAACPDAGAEFACAAASTPPSAPIVAAPATAPVAILTNSLRPIPDSLPPSLRFFMLVPSERRHPQGRSPEDPLLFFPSRWKLCRRYTTRSPTPGKAHRPRHPDAERDAGLKTPALRSNLLRLLALATQDSLAPTLSS